MAHHSTPDIVPLLGRGRHRSMRKGACFMEMASYLAGEKWSDHPHCTHPLLAEVARDVNDAVSDGARQHLAPMIPDVVGLNPSDPRVDAWLARLCAITALPISPRATQRAAAVGLLRCESALAELESRPPGDLSPVAVTALAEVPDAADWARDLVRDIGFPAGRAAHRAFVRHTGTAIVRSCVRGVSDACILDPEERLVDLLRRSIELCREAARAEAMAGTTAPASARELMDR
jgi:hypothetical protein